MILGISITAWIAAIVALIAIGVALMKLGLKLKNKKPIDADEVSDIVEDLVDVVEDLKDNYEENNSLQKKWTETNRPLLIKRDPGERPILRTDDIL